MRSVLLAVHQDALSSFVRVLESSMPDFQQVVASTPEQARSAYEAWHSELVIVDARLSLGGMLDFVDWLQRQSPDTQIIALCELDTFDQVQRVLRPDAADYLIHPFRAEDLERLLASLEERRLAIQASSAPLRPVIERDRDTAAEARCQALIASLAAGPLSQEQREVLRSMLPTPNGVALIAAAKSEQALEAAEEMLFTYLGGISGIRIARDAARNQLLALVWLSPRHHTEWLRKQLTAATAHLRYASGMTVDIGISLQCEDLTAEGTKAFEQANQALAYRFYEEQGALVLYEDNLFAMRQDLPYLSPAADALEKAIASGDSQAASQALERMIRQMDTWPRAQPQRVLRYMQRFLQRLVYLFGGSRSEALAAEATEGVSQATTLAALQEAAGKTIRALLPQEDNAEHAATLCMEDMQREPGKALSVEEAAAHYGVTPDALDRAITASTGLSFMRYQRQLRMTRAKQLFDDTSLPLSAIALQVGYPDPAYFVRVYQKVTGELPPR